MSESKSYLEIIAEVEKEVQKELPLYRSLGHFRQLQKLTLNLNNYCNYSRSAERYRKLEKNNPDKYQDNRQKDEFCVLLSSTRLKFNLQASDENVLQAYVFHLKSKLEEALAENDIKKRFKLFDYVSAGCTHCKVENAEIMSEINAIRDKAQKVISDIRTM